MVQAFKGLKTVPIEIMISGQLLLGQIYEQRQYYDEGKFFFLLFVTNLLLFLLKNNKQ